MIELLFRINPFILVFINSIFVIGIALVIHIYARRAIKSYITGDDVKIGTMLFSVNASILSLLFSITLFQVRGEFNHITNSSGEEISQLNDVRRDIENLTPTNQKEVIKKFQHYLTFVVNNEFNLEINQEIIDESNIRFDNLRNTVLKLPPATYVEKQFRNHIYSTLEKMVENRGVRLYRSSAKVSPIFYLLMLIFLLSLIFLTTFERTKLSMIFVSAYSFLGAILLTFILVTSTYFHGEGTKNREFFVKSLEKVELKMLQLETLPEEQKAIDEVLEAVENDDESDED